MNELMFIIFLIIVLFVLVLIINIGIKSYSYKKSLYYSLTKTSKRKLLNDRGRLGEFQIMKLLEKQKGKHEILMNIYLPVNTETTTECDIIFINKYGIFVVESKNLTGMIYGDADVRYWTQEIGRKTHSFYSPVKQNKNHIKAVIKNIIINKNDLYHSVIVFGSNANIKKVKVKVDNTYVINVSSLKKTFRKIKKRGNIVLNDYEIDEIKLRLLPYTNASYFTKRDHIKNIKSKK